MHIASQAFEHDGDIPARFTRGGDNALPPLEWQGAPAMTRSYALMIEDPDAPDKTFLHCLLYDIPLHCHRIDQQTLTGREQVGVFAHNDFGNRRYDGPEPPQGHGPHRYHFKLAALDVPTLGLPAGTPPHEIWRLAEVHALEIATMIGVHERH